MIRGLCMMPLVDREQRATLCPETATMERDVGTGHGDERASLQVCATHAAELDARGEAPSTGRVETLDAMIARLTKQIRDENRAKRAAAAEEVRRELDTLRTACEDAHGVAADLLKPLRKRELGHVQHARIYGDAREQILSGLAYLAKLLIEPDAPTGESPVK